MVSTSSATVKESEDQEGDLKMKRLLVSIRSQRFSSTTAGN